MIRRQNQCRQDQSYRSFGHNGKPDENVSYPSPNTASLVVRAVQAKQAPSSEQRKRHVGYGFTTSCQKQGSTGERQCRKYSGTLAGKSIEKQISASHKNSPTGCPEESRCKFIDTEHLISKC